MLLHSVLSRQLNKHTMGYLTYKGGLHSSMKTTVVRETEKSWMQFTIQVMTQNNKIVLNIWMSPFQTFNQLPCLVEGGCLAYSQGLNSTVASQSLDRILPLWLANPCNPAMSSHFRQLSYWWNSGRKKNKGWEGEDAKAITPQTAALMLNEELKDPSSVQSYHVWWACTYGIDCWMLMDHLNTKLVDH